MNQLLNPGFSGAFRKLLKEPFLHFLFFGAIIFLAGAFYQARIKSDRYILKVGKEELAKLEQDWEKQYATPPSKEQIEALVANYIREEIFYREGVELNLGSDDEIVRRRIAQKYEFLQQDHDLSENPSEGDLKDYYAGNKSKYIIPPHVSFSHIYFSTDKEGDSPAKFRALRILNALQKGDLKRAPELGDRFAFQYDYAQLSKVDAGKVFGQSVLSDSLFSVPTGKWVGPIRSGYGWHLIFVNSSEPSVLRPFEEVRGQVTENYLEVFRDQKNQESFAKLEKKYHLELSQN
jgi:peptidyl-prolyl cis-trans isomerase C